MRRYTERYGNFYWCIGVPSSIAEDGEIYVMADRVTIEDGTLICWQDSKQDATGNRVQLESPRINLALSKGQWLHFFAASLIDGAAVSVEHWKGRIAEQHRQERKATVSVLAEARTKIRRTSHPERNRMSQSLRYTILHRDGFRCRSCGKSGKDEGVILEVDHIVPVSKGGESHEDNLQALCRECNRGKGAHMHGSASA